MLPICLSAILLAFLGANRPLIAQDRIITNERYGFSIKLPEGFESVSAGMPALPEQVALLVRPAGGGFPTFNIVVQPLLDIGLADSNETAERIVSDYRQIGLTDARLVSSRLTRIDSKSAQHVVLTYASAGKLFSSEVYLVRFAGREFTLTYICEQPACPSLRHIKDVLLGSLTFEPRAEANPIPTTYVKPTRWNVLAILFISLLLAGLLFFRFYKRAR